MKKLAIILMLFLHGCDGDGPVDPKPVGPILNGYFVEYSPRDSVWACDRFNRRGLIVVRNDGDQDAYDVRVLLHTECSSSAVITFSSYIPAGTHRDAASRTVAGRYVWVTATGVSHD